jgi:hypothetical protein
MAGGINTAQCPKHAPPSLDAYSNCTNAYTVCCRRHQSQVFEVGRCYEVGNGIAALFLAEGWAEPVELDAPQSPEPFGLDDPFAVPLLDRNSPPNLIKEHAPPFLDRHQAADFRWRRRRRGRDV